MKNETNQKSPAFATNIKRLRISHNLTQLELAKIAGVSDKAVSTWESGRKMPRIQVLNKLCDYFGVSFGELFEEEEKRTDEPVSKKEKELLKWFRRLSDKEQDVIFYLTKKAGMTIEELLEEQECQEEEKKRSDYKEEKKDD